MVDHVTQSAVMSAGEELANLLRKRQSLGRIEKAVSQRLLCDVDWSFFISGRNRQSERSKNVVRQAKGGRYVIILNAVDGHVNYLRGSRLFGGSISIVDSFTRNRYAVVYDGLYDKLLEFSSSKDISNRGLISNGAVGRVIGLWRLLPLNTKASLKGVSKFSLRSLGSTTLSILEVIAGRIDAYVCCTKLWNFHWALSLCESRAISLVVNSEEKPVAAIEEHLLEHPNKSVVLSCYTGKQIVQGLSDILKSATNYYQEQYGGGSL